MKNKLLVCFRPVAVEAEEVDAGAEEVVAGVSSARRSSWLRKSKSLMIESDTKLVDDEIKNIKRKETNRSMSGSFVVGLSLKKRSSSFPKGHGTIDLRNASKRDHFSSEDKCLDDCMTIEQSLPSFDREELERGSLKNPDKKGEGCKIMGSAAESKPRSRWVVYSILVMSLLATVFYGRVCSVLVTSSSCLFLCLPRWKTKPSSRTRSARFHDDDDDQRESAQS